MFSQRAPRYGALLAITDSIALAAALYLAVRLHPPWPPKATELAASGLSLFYATGAFAVLSWVLVTNVFDLNRLRGIDLNELFAIGRACAATTFLVLILGFLAHLPPPPRLTVALAFAFGAVLVPAQREFIRRSIGALYARSGILIPLVVVGFNPLGRYVRDQILDELRSCDFLGFLDDAARGNGAGDGRVLGGTAEIGAIAAANPGLEVAIVLPEADPEYIHQIVARCEHNHARWSVMPAMFRSLSAGLRVDMAGVIPLIGPRNSNIEGVNFLLKRGFDVAAASLLLVLASPLLLLTFAAIRLFDGPPLLFRQIRIGLHGRPFELLKFRTMRTLNSDAVHREYVRKWIQEQGAAAADANGASLFKLPDDRRITALGRWLRRFSIDELPQLFNVLRGQMSLIGPRPALPYEIDLYQDWHRRRLEAPPGITGLWQVSGRNHLSFEDMVRLDIKYIEDWSLGRDIAILLRTVPAILQGEGV